MKKWKRGLFTALAGGAGMAVIGTLTGLISNAVSGNMQVLSTRGVGWSTYLFALLGSYAYAGFVWGLFYLRFAPTKGRWIVHGLLYGLGLFAAGLLPGVILVDIAFSMAGDLIGSWGVSSLFAALAGGTATAYVYQVLSKEETPAAKTTPDAGSTATGTTAPSEIDILLGRDKKNEPTQ